MQDTKNYFAEILTALLATVLPAVVGWFGRLLFERQKERKENALTDVELSEKIASMWWANADKYDQKVEMLTAKVDKMQTEMWQLKEENQNLKIENRSLTNQVDKLSKRLSQYEQKHGE